MAVCVPALFYGALASSVWFEEKGRARVQLFGSYDALIAGGLMLLFAIVIISGFSAGGGRISTKLPSNADMIVGVVLSTGMLLLIMAAIVGSLKLRHVPWLQACGLERIDAVKVFAQALLLLLLAFPLIYAALAMTRILLAGSGYQEDAPQELVRFLAASGSGATRAVVAFSAVCIAPFQEEFIFRGFIYGVARRYGGPVPGMLVNATLFAGIHLHAPSFGPLFVLAVCLTLAYEWTGSLYVPITMHALFNAFSVVNLLTGHGDA